VTKQNDRDADPSETTEKASAPRRARAATVQKEQPPLPAEIREILLEQRTSTEKFFWGVTIACFAGLILFDLVIVPFSGANLTVGSIASINGALGGSGGLLGFIAYKIFHPYTRI
jgi:hypothetical protein